MKNLLSPAIFLSLFITLTVSMILTCSKRIEACEVAIIVNGSEAFCAGESRVLLASTGLSFVWSTGETSQSIEVTDSGVYSVAVTDAEGCVAEAEQAMVALPVPSGQAFATDPPPFCAGDVVTLVALGVPLADDFLWSTGQTTQTIEVSESGLYSVVVTNLAGCSAESFVPVGFVPSPAANVLSPSTTTACQGEAVTLQAAPSFGSSFVWSNGVSGSSILVTEGGDYTVTVTNLAGCTSTSVPVTVQFLAIPAISAGEDVSICEGEVVTLNASGSATVLWSPGDVSDLEMVVSPVSTTVYVVTDTGVGCGQGQTDTVVVMVNPAPVAAFTHIGDQLGAPLVFTDASVADTPVTSWVWDFGDGQVSLSQHPIYTYAGSAGSYVVTLTVTTLAGCIDTISGDVTLRHAVVRGDVLTPNGDGVNDHVIFADSRAQWLDISIYNRWGHETWTAKGQELRFTGRTSAGVRMPPGTYFYVLATEFTDGNRDMETGTITILGDQGF